MLLKIRKEGSPVECITEPSAAALYMAQNPNVPFRVRQHDRDTDPLPEILEFLNVEHDCSLVHQGDTVSAHPRYK